MAEYRPDPINYPSMWNYKPDDTEDYFYIRGSATISEILNAAYGKWEGATIEDLNIFPEKIHARCIYYDIYDSSDYDDYLRIERILKE